MAVTTVMSFQQQCLFPDNRRLMSIQLLLLDHGSFGQRYEPERNPNPVFPPLNNNNNNNNNNNSQQQQQQHPTTIQHYADHHHHQQGPNAQPEAAVAPSASPLLGTTNKSSSSSSFSSQKEVYKIASEEEYRTLLQAHPDKLIVLKFYASFCRSCKALAPKMLSIMRDEQLHGLPIVWAEFESMRSNKDLFRSLGIMTLPTIHFYDGSPSGGGGLVENFPCPPSKLPLLKKKLARFINTRVDPTTRRLMEPPETTTISGGGGGGVNNEEGTSEPRRERRIANNEMITGEHLDFLRNDLPFFQDLTDEEFDALMDNARLLTFDAGDVIRKQGMPASTFYVIKSGAVEMSIKSRFDDPISTPPTYLGLVVNTLKKFDYFGERALTTGEPFAASFRALDKVRCFAFHVDHIPPSSILSKQHHATRETVEMLSKRYVLPDDYSAPLFAVVSKRDENILDLLVRFKQIRQAARCFEYMIQNNVTWGDAGEIRRRTLLVRKLTYSQRNEFNDVFNIVDVHRRGRISLLELKKFLISAKEAKTDIELTEMIHLANPTMDGDTYITREEFMGVMAEAEFYNLFKETFQELDQENTGFVRAGDLDSVLGGVRDLIGDKQHTSIIDIDDKDMLVDYEQFSKMLLGAAL
eukprot:scaffold22639_cov105-Cylindrotheca_fusiformis.AAC.8